MNRTLRISGLALAALTISTVAMAQQGGGGGGGGGEGGGGDTSIIELRLQDHERARLTRAREDRRQNPNCLSHACNDQPTGRPNGRGVELARESCGGGDMLVYRDRSGRIIRIVCERR